MSTRVEKPRSAEVDRATRLRLYQLMVELRDFEQRAYELFLENLVRGTSHLALPDFTVAFAGAALLALLNLPFGWVLHPHAAAEVSGHKPKEIAT